MWCIFIIQYYPTCLIYAKPQTKTASKFKGNINILNTKHNLESEKNLIWGQLVFVQGKERALKVDVVVLCQWQGPAAVPEMPKSRGSRKYSSLVLGSTYSWVAFIEALLRFPFKHVMSWGFWFCFFVFLVFHKYLEEYTHVFQVPSI